MAWQILAFSAVILFTALNLLQRVLAVECKNARAMSVVFNLVAGILAVILFFATGSHKAFVIPTDYRAFLGLGAAALFYALFERGRFQAAKLLDASVLTTVSNISVPVAFIGALFLYSETLTTQKILGSGLILLALILVSYNRTKQKYSQKGIIIALLISVSLGLAWMLDKLGAQYFNPNSYSILIWTIPIIFIYLPYVKFKDLKTEFVGAPWKIFILALN